MKDILSGFKSVLSARGVGQALAIALVVYVVLVTLHKYDGGKYAPENV